MNQRIPFPFQDLQPSQKSRKVLIAGCGFVGEATAFLFQAASWEVVGLVSSLDSSRIHKSNRFSVLPCDIGNTSAVQDLHDKIGPMDAVVHCASSGGKGFENYRRVYLEGFRNLLTVFSPEAQTFLFTSSTSVYAQTDGSVVTEDSPTEPMRETGHVLLEAEALALRAHGYVLRLAGIYGPNRSIYLQRFLKGEAILEEDGKRWINQIHRDDAAAAIFHLLQKEPPRGIYNCCDDAPANEHDVYQWLAEYFQRPLPPCGERNPHRKRAWTNKRVSNAKLKAMGWHPQFPCYRDSLPYLAKEV